MVRRLTRSMMICCRRVNVLDTNCAHDGRAVRHARLRTHRSRATVALAFTLMCAIIGVASTCRSLLCDLRHSPSVSPYLGIRGTCRRRQLSLRSDVRQVIILQRMHCEGADQHRHCPVNCHASMETHFRWTRTVAQYSVQMNTQNAGRHQ